MADELLTTSQVAELAHVSEQTVRRWRFDGDLPFVRLGYRTIRHRRGDVLALLEGRTERTVAFSAQAPERPRPIVTMVQGDGATQRVAVRVHRHPFDATD